MLVVVVVVAAAAVAAAAVAVAVETGFGKSGSMKELPAARVVLVACGVDGACG